MYIFKSTKSTQANQSCLNTVFTLFVTVQKVRIGGGVDFVDGITEWRSECQRSETGVPFPTVTVPESPLVPGSECMDFYESLCFAEGNQ